MRDPSGWNPGVARVFLVPALLLAMLFMHTVNGPPAHHSSATVAAWVTVPVAGTFAMPDGDDLRSSHSATHSPAASVDGGEQRAAGRQVVFADGGSGALTEVVTAMCLMIVVALLVVASPLRGVVLARGMDRVAGFCLMGAGVRVCRRPPSLATLGISRT